MLHCSPAALSYFKDVPEEEREALEGRLKQESLEIKADFAVLSAKTKKLLEQKKTASQDIIFLFKSYSKLYKAIKQYKNFNKLLLKLSDYWSFFDYDILQLIIRSYCNELIDEFIEYEEKFKSYCRRRLCEVPDGIVGVKTSKDYVFCKYDEMFSYEKTRLWDVKVLNAKLSKLLKTKLVLRSIREGCIEITYVMLCDILYPLSTKQMAQLKRLNIVRMFSECCGLFDIDTQNLKALR